MSDQRLIAKTGGGVELPISAFQELDNSGSFQVADTVARQHLATIRANLLANYGELTAAAEALTEAATIIEGQADLATGLANTIPDYQHVAEYAQALDFLTIYQDGLVKKISVDGLVGGSLARAKIADVQITQQHIAAGGPGYAFFQVSPTPFNSSSSVEVWIDGRYMAHGYGWEISADSTGINAWIPEAGPGRDAYIDAVTFTVRWFE